jgi:hypothetical protein
MTEIAIWDFWQPGLQASGFFVAAKRDQKSALSRHSRSLLLRP